MAPVPGRRPLSPWSVLPDKNDFVYLMPLAMPESLWEPCNLWWVALGLAVWFTFWRGCRLRSAMGLVNHVYMTEPQ